MGARCSSLPNGCSDPSSATGRDFQPDPPAQRGPRKEPATQERLAHDAAIAIGSTPAAYAKFIAAEQKRWQPVLVRAKIKPE